MVVVVVVFGEAVLGGVVAVVVVSGDVVVGWGVVAGVVVVAGMNEGAVVGAVVMMGDAVAGSATVVETADSTVTTVVDVLSIVDVGPNRATVRTVVGLTVVAGVGLVRWRTVTMAAAAAPAAVITPAMTPIAAPRVRRRRKATTFDVGTGTALMSSERSLCSSRSTKPGSGSSTGCRAAPRKARDRERRDSLMGAPPSPGRSSFAGALGVHDAASRPGPPSNSRVPLPRHRPRGHRDIAG